LKAGELEDLQMIARYMTSALLGLTMAFGLLFLMHTLIDTGNAAFTPDIRVMIEHWIHQPNEEKPPLIDEPPQRVIAPELPPTSNPPISIDNFGGIGGIPIPVGEPLGPGQPGSITAHRDRPLVNMVRVQPAYPPRAAALGLEGFVTVGYDVSAAGTVINVVILDSSHTIFEKSAMNAALKFRFKPRLVDGIPVGSTGMKNRFRFQMEK
jgi:protein TonB